MADNSSENNVRAHQSPHFLSSFKRSNLRRSTVSKYVYNSPENNATG